MPYKSGVSWTQASHGFWYGCRKVSSGCRFCYAERDIKRFGGNFSQVRRSQSFNKPLIWNEPRLIFVNPWSDFFIDKADMWREEAWDVIRKTKHTYQILTKRPERIHDCLPSDWGDGWNNVWLGVTVEEQKYMYRFDLLARIPAVVRFLSVEPMLGPVTIPSKGVDWVIVGGESGYTPRPMDLDWARSVRDQCKQLSIPFFFKQVGGSKKIEGTWGGKRLDGEIYQEFPNVFQL